MCNVKYIDVKDHEKHFCSHVKPSQGCWYPGLWVKRGRAARVQPSLKPCELNVHASISGRVVMYEIPPWLPDMNFSVT